MAAVHLLQYWTATYVFIIICMPPHQDPASNVQPVYSDMETRTLKDLNLVFKLCNKSGLLSKHFYHIVFVVLQAIALAPLSKVASVHTTLVQVFLPTIDKMIEECSSGQVNLRYLM